MSRHFQQAQAFNGRQRFDIFFIYFLQAIRYTISFSRFYFPLIGDTEFKLLSGCCRVSARSAFRAPTSHLPTNEIY